MPDDAILSENEGIDDVRVAGAAAAGLLAAAGVDEVVLVTDPYHSLRSRLIAGEVGLDASLSPTPDQRGDRIRASFRKELLEAGGVAVGRIIGFDRLSGSPAKR